MRQKSFPDSRLPTKNCPEIVVTEMKLSKNAANESSQCYTGVKSKVQGLASEVTEDHHRFSSAKH